MLKVHCLVIAVTQLFGCSSADLAQEEVVPKNKDAIVGYFPQPKTQYFDYIDAFCEPEKPVVQVVISEDGVTVEESEDLTYYLCVPHEGTYAIDILCVQDECSQGVSKYTIQDFEENAKRIEEEIKISESEVSI
jgi:hypothetical protein